VPLARIPPRPGPWVVAGAASTPRHLLSVVDRTRQSARPRDQVQADREQISAFWSNRRVPVFGPYVRVVNSSRGETPMRYANSGVRRRPPGPASRSSRNRPRHSRAERLGVPSPGTGHRRVVPPGRRRRGRDPGMDRRGKTQGRGRTAAPAQPSGPYAAEALSASAIRGARNPLASCHLYPACPSCGQARRLPGPGPDSGLAISASGTP
jgi:hypothetical protein